MFLLEDNKRAGSKGAQVTLSPIIAESMCGVDGAHS